MIAGIGVDVVDLPRFIRSTERTPALLERLFTPAERPLPLHSLAGRFAAKEALVKALGGAVGARWQEIAVVADVEGAPSFELSGEIRAEAARRGITRVHLSISHDAGIATAFVVAESDGVVG